MRVVVCISIRRLILRKECELTKTPLNLILVLGGLDREQIRARSFWDTFLNIGFQTYVTYIKSINVLYLWKQISIWYIHIYLHWTYLFFWIRLTLFLMIMRRLFQCLECVSLLHISSEVYCKHCIIWNEGIFAISQSLFQTSSYHR